MRASKLLMPTDKMDPKDAELISHKLMLRAGYIRKTASGIYSYLPLGLKVLHKISNIIRQELNAIDANEILMPNIIPATLWQESQRWEQYGHLLLKVQDRHQRDFCFGPTHEEVITDLARNNIQSYRQLPMTLYQIQTKFRDELRPRYGVLRAREFVMKDAYSFHLNQTCLETTYNTIKEAYCRIFDRLQLRYRMVVADSGDIGGELSHEFHVLAQSGEDHLFYSDNSDYAANVEKATARCSEPCSPDCLNDIEKISTPNIKTIAHLTEFVNQPAHLMVKTIVVKNQDNQMYALVLRADHTLNETKAAHLPELNGMAKATSEDIAKAYDNSDVQGYIGPYQSPIPLIVDHEARALYNFYCGANQKDMHLKGVNWDRDIKEFQAADLRNVEVGDVSPDGQGHLQHCKGIEVGHIFQLGTKYSEKMDYLIQNEHKEKQCPLMGCYGLGVSRIIGAAVEQNHDERGIIWPEAIAPYQVAIVGIQYHKNGAVQQAADTLYQQLKNKGFDVLLDDRNERPGAIFADLDLIGIPHRVVIGPKTLDQNLFEYKKRGDDTTELLTLDALVSHIT